MPPGLFVFFSSEQVRWKSHAWHEVYGLFHCQKGVSTRLGLGFGLFQVINRFDTAPLSGSGVAMSEPATWHIVLELQDLKFSAAPLVARA